MKVWDIIKLKAYASSPKYKYKILTIGFEAYNIKKEDNYLLLQNITFNNQLSFISSKSVEEVLN